MRRVINGFLVLVVFATLVFADSPHYKRGPFFSDNGFTATATGSITGLGNGDVMITLSFPNAVGTTICTSPGGNDSPGQNPAVPASVSGTAFIDDPKNGTLRFTVTTLPPADPTPQQAGCPNPNWTARFDDLTFGDGTLTVSQETSPGVFVAVLTTNVTL